MLSKKWSVVFALLVIGSTLLAACAAPEVQTVVVTQVVEKAGETVIEEVVVTATPAPPPKEMRPNVLRLNFMGPGDVPTIDPALSTDTSSVQIVDELTVGLTRLNEVTLELEPGMAESWDASEDGLTYVFQLREGIPWVRWNGSEVEQVLDCEGNVRTVTAHDFEYGIKRTGIPETASDYGYVLGFAIEGFNELNTAEGWADLSDEEKQALIDGVAAKALDDYTLEVTFTTPAVYNANIIGMWVGHAQPKWVIEGDECNDPRGDRWSEPGINQSYGPYALKDWVHDFKISIVKNPFWPDSVPSVPQPQVDEIVWTMVATSAEFAEYEAGNLDASAVPLADLDRVRADPVLSKELYIAPAGCTYYYGFNTSKPPMDNVHMRRALSHAIDRLGLVENVTKGGQEPAQWFCRPGMAACPTMDSHPDLGIKTDAEAANAELQAYMDEMGYASIDEIPEIILMYNTSEGHKRIAEAIAEMWKETLGIEVTITNQEWKVYLKTLQEDSPQVWRLGWCLDYPDANNWTKEVMAIGGHEERSTQWRNEVFSAMLDEAAVEPDPVKRQQMYADAEQILCYDDAAIAPIYWYTSVNVTKPYVNRTHSQHGHEAYEKWSLDLEIE
jgi:oligopeptide transport system substrate-binding protein